MNIIKKRNILQNELNKIEEQIKALKQQQMLIFQQKSLVQMGNL